MEEDRGKKEQIKKKLLNKMCNCRKSKRKSFGEESCQDKLKVFES
jgi:hypothetical protein